MIAFMLENKVNISTLTLLAFSSMPTQVAIESHNSIDTLKLSIESSDLYWPFLVLSLLCFLVFVSFHLRFYLFFFLT